MEKHKFSILIANYNNGRFFRDCYNSIINQTYTNWEAVIVDDASTDNSVEEIRTIIGNDDRFIFVQNEKNGGCGFAKNRCVQLATGEFCGFLDPDDALEHNALEVMVAKHLEFPNASLIYSKNTNRNANMEFISVNHKEQQPKDVPVFVRFYVSHFATFKKSFYAISTGINPLVKRAVDIDLYCALDEVGDIVYVDQSLYNYRIHNTGISTLANRHKAEYWEFIVKHFHAQRRNRDCEEEFKERILYYKSDLSMYSNLKLLKVIISRLLRGQPKKRR